MYLVKLKLLIAQHEDVTLKYGDELVKRAEVLLFIKEEDVGQKQERERERERERDENMREKEIVI